MEIFILSLFLYASYAFPTPEVTIDKSKINNKVINDNIKSKLVKAVIAEHNDENVSRTLSPGFVASSLITVFNLVEEVFYHFGGDDNGIGEEYPRNIQEILDDNFTDVYRNDVKEYSKDVIVTKVVKDKKKIKKSQFKKMKENQIMVDLNKDDEEDEEDDEEGNDEEDDEEDDDDEDVNKDQNDNKEDADKNDNAEGDEEEEDDDEPAGGLLGAIIAGFLGSLSKPDGSVDVDAVIGVISSLSAARDDGTYDFSGLTDTINSFFGGGGDEGGGSDIGTFLGGLISAFIKGVANPPGAKGAGKFLGKIVNGVLPALSAPPEETESKPELDAGGFLFSILNTVISGSIPGFGGTDKPSLIEVKFGLLKFILGIVSSILKASHGG